MNKELDFDVEELGVATAETRGSPIKSGEPQGGQPLAGISDAD